MNTIDHNHPEPTAQVPLLDGIRLKLVAALKNKQSYYDLSLLFPDIVREAKKMPPWMYGFRKRNMTAEYLSVKGVKDPSIWEILHTIPPDVLTSVALGTVAFDMQRYGERPKTTGRIKFIESDEKIIHVEELIRSLQRRLDRSLALDPTGRTPLIQTPIYIGCSGTLETRMPKHGIDTNLSQSNSSYAFTVSVMRMLGYEPSSTVMCVTRLWKPQQLPKAEVLIAAFANSYITQDGFNRIECGDSSGSTLQKSEAVLQAQSSEAEEYIAARCPFMLDNLTASLDAIESKLDFLVGCDSLSLLYDPPGNTFQDELDTLVDDHNALILVVQQIDILLTRSLKINIEKAEEEKQALDDDIELIRLLKTLGVSSE
ncbi:hypothetical protein SLS53_009168 [Cytospora paraplurivora]|uniref:Uncharacterized protein n=1 Tax=Cytospora paraplurivora TaxID=2898453 RepID=A0AAN9TVR5_9PEZI